MKNVTQKLEQVRRMAVAALARGQGFEAEGYLRMAEALKRLLPPPAATKAEYVPRRYR